MLARSFRRLLDLFGKGAGPGLGGIGEPHGTGIDGAMALGSDVEKGSVEIRRVVGGGPLRLRERGRFSRHRRDGKT